MHESKGVLDDRYKKLVDEVSTLRNALKEKNDEVIFLNAYILEKSRLVNLLRELVRVSDKSITFRLERKIKRKRHYPNIAIDSFVKRNLELYLDTINKADQKAYVTKPGIADQTIVAVFKILLMAYRIVKKLAFRIARSSFVLVKQIPKVLGRRYS